MSGRRIQFGDILNVQVGPKSLAREYLMRSSVISVDISEEIHTISQAFQVQVSTNSPEQHVDFEREVPKKFGLLRGKTVLHLKIWTYCRV